ncbi:MAG TPA: chitobiase/beta-hexosaminidase C-terminal domain-containing protein [Candidatus Cloacimonadota bacterium]|nr:chitobiase/beta-hexosaminidase C-terminal domain-containing protein [Candidatus Cloacimonadota bacterium]
MRKTLFLLLFGIIAISMAFGATAVVTSRPSQIDISSTTSESAVLMTVSGYTSDDARYRLYNGSNQYNCWDPVTNAYITSTSYSAGPRVPGTPTTSSTWWIPFQCGNNAVVAASYRDRLGTAYSANYMTAALPAANAITTASSITNANVTFTTWNTYTQKYVILAYDATSGGTLISATSSALSTGAFDLKYETGTVIRRIEVRDLNNALIESVTGTWGSGTPTPTINVTGSLTAFSTTTGTPSANQSYTLSGSNLTANISVAVPAGFVISTDQSTWLSSLSLASTFSGSVYVRMTGTSAGSFSGNITHNSTGATEVTLAVSGTVTDPTPTINATGTLNPFTAIVGTPSAAQSYTLTGSFLTASIVVTPPAGFEISTDGTTYNSSVSVASTYNGLIYVRLTGATVGSYSGNITHTSAGATQVDKAVSGTVSNPVGPTILFEENFNYATGALLTDNGWVVTGTAATPTVVVSEGSVTYPGYFMYGGNGVTLATSGQDVNHTFDAQSSGSVYSAFVINVSSAQSTGDYFLTFGQAAMGTSYYGRVFLKRDGATDNAFIGVVFASGTGAVTQYTTTSYPYGTNVLLVLKYQIVDGALNDTVSLFVNPAISGTEPSATLTSPSGYTEAPADPASIGSIGLRQGSASKAAVVKVDGIRVSNNWGLLWSGTAPPSPVITVTGTLEPFACIVNNPSEEIQSYTLTGSNLNGSLIVTAPTGFQLSVNGVDGWESILTLASNYNGQVYVRMLGTENRTYEGNITHSSLGATQVDLPVSGEAFNPSVTWNITQSLTAFSSEAGTPSANQSYTMSATNATGSINVSVEAPFELSTTGTGGWLTSLDLAYNFNGSIYVRMNSASVGTFNGTIVHFTADATNYDIAVSGTASAPAGNYAADLFFSEYIEGGSNNKALEIFNGTGAPVDLFDYKVVLYSNGSTTPGNTLIFPAGTMLAHNDVYVIANAAANATILALADTTSTVTYYNGDDAVALIKTVDGVDQYVDIFGRIGEDPGTAWTADGGYSTLDKTLVRKPTIIAGISVNPTAGFPTLNTEWDVYPVDTTTYLGAHTFTPGMEVVATPVISPVSGVYSTPQTVTITCATASASIYYTTNGTEPTEASTLYTSGFSVSATTTVKAKAYKTGFTASSVATATYNFPTNVANIAALRASATGTTVYRLTGEAVLTFQQASRHQKYVQDATAAIVVDDVPGIITTIYNLYDGITGITGTLGLYNGLLQFTPVADPGAATSSNNVVIPELRTLATITTDDQAKLLKVMNVTLDTSLGTFGTTAQNINATDASGTLVMRTFPAADYAGSPIPSVPTDIICLGGQFNTTMQFSPRFLSDMTPSASIIAPTVTIANAGANVQLSWAAVAGATSYRIEGSNNPYGAFTTITTQAGLTWSGAAANMKFFRVIAIQ